MLSGLSADEETETQSSTAMLAQAGDSNDRARAEACDKAKL